MKPWHSPPSFAVNVSAPYRALSGGASLFGWTKRKSGCASAIWKALCTLTTYAVSKCTRSLNVFTSFHSLCDESGATYDGEWKDDCYHGWGRYTWPDGTKYEGSFEKSAMHGVGTYTDKEGRQWTGDFYNNTGPGLKMVV